jgi:hypothetical protein
MRNLPLATWAAGLVLSLGLAALPGVASAADIDPAAIVRAPTDVPPPAGKREPTTITADILVAETMGRLADGTEYWYWTFGGTVPGAGPDDPRQGRRHRRHQPEERFDQRLPAQRRPACRDRHEGRR